MGGSNDIMQIQHVSLHYTHTHTHTHTNLLTHPAAPKAVLGDVIVCLQYL